jgi:hypothetical protein
VLWRRAALAVRRGANFFNFESKPASPVQNAAQAWRWFGDCGHWISKT